MRLVAPLLLSLAVFTVHAQDAPEAADVTGDQAKVAIVIHGGAGYVPRESLSADEERAYRADLERAREAGYRVLAGNGTALDAVQAAVRILEESPRFNAGKGAVFNAQGRHELDASIMEGHTRRAGAVAGVTTVRSPISLARAVMEHSEHVMMAGAGAEAFADTRPELERVPNDWFDTERRRRALEQAQAGETAASEGDAGEDRSRYFGTVGAVALDVHGHIAAATSTGGMTNKRWGRIGDSPIIGAGTWADRQCGVSGTGWGEFYIRHAVAHDICARVAYRGDSLVDAAQAVVNEDVPGAGGNGGAIALDAQGNIAMPFNTGTMFRTWVKPDGSRGTAIFEE